MPGLLNKCYESTDGLICRFNTLFWTFVWASYAVNAEDHKLEKPSGGEDNGVEPMTFPQNLRDALTS